jgi:hypothetical protein
MSEENSSSVGTLIGVAVIAGLIGFFIGKPNPTYEEANNSPSDQNSSTKLEKNPPVNIPMGDGLVAYYPFNGDAKDASGNGNNGFVIGATLSQDRNGEMDNAYLFDGSDRVLVGDNPEIRLQKLTINVWAKSSLESKDDQANPQWPTVLAKRINYHRSPYSSWFLGTGGESNKYWQASEGIKSKEEISEGSWQMLTLTIEKGYQALYLDGEMQNEKRDSDESGKDIIYSDLPLFIGFSGFHDQHWVGSIDDVRIYNRALSEGEVKALYDLEKPKGK